jgi:hypothetical protein
VRSSIDLRVLPIGSFLSLTHVSSGEDSEPALFDKLAVHAKQTSTGGFSEDLIAIAITPNAIVGLLAVDTKDDLFNLIRPPDGLAING